MSQDHLAVAAAPLDPPTGPALGRLVRRAGAACGGMSALARAMAAVGRPVSPGTIRFWERGERMTPLPAVTARAVEAACGGVVRAAQFLGQEACDPSVLRCHGQRR